MISRDIVVQKLQELNGDMLKSPYRHQWTQDNPTLGYCYVVSEALYHYLEGEIKAYCISMGEAGTHWFVRIDGKIVDYTSEQFSEPVDYSKAVCKGFFKGGVKTSRGYISKRGQAMAIHLGLV